MSSCIVCKRPIPKKVTVYFIMKPREAVPERKGLHNGMAAIPDGSRVQNTFYLATRPQTKAEVQRLVNEPVLSIRRGIAGVDSFATWDGESYKDEYFCRNKCAMEQGYASAHHGHRFIWKDES